ISAPPGQMSFEAMESWLVSLLAARLRVEASSINATQPISQLGADSLTSLELAHAIESSLGADLSASGFLGDFSVRELAARILALPSGGSAMPEPTVEPSSGTALAQPI